MVLSVVICDFCILNARLSVPAYVGGVLSRVGGIDP